MGFGNSITTGITDETEVYNPTADIGTVMGMTIAPISGSDATVDVKIDNGYLIKGLSLSNGTTSVPVGDTHKLVVVKDKPIKVTSSTEVDVIVSYFEP